MLQFFFPLPNEESQNHGRKHTHYPKTLCNFSVSKLKKKNEIELEALPFHPHAPAKIGAQKLGGDPTPLWWAVAEAPCRVTQRWHLQNLENQLVLSM